MSNVRTRSNFHEIRAALFGLGQTLNLRRRLPGGRRLGDELLDTAGLSIAHRTVDQQKGPDGATLPPLREAYRRWKRRHGYSPKTLVRTGGMTDPVQVSGQHTVTSTTATMEAGLDEATKEKVEYAEEGHGNRPPRHWYDLDKEGEKEVDDLIDGVIDQQIKAMGG